MSFKRASGYLPSRSSAARSSSARWKSRRDWSERISHGLASMSLPIADRTVSTRLQARLRRFPALRKELCGFGVWTPNAVRLGLRQVHRRIGQDLDTTAILANPGENTHLPGDFYDRLVESITMSASQKQEVYGEVSLAHFRKRVLRRLCSGAERPGRKVQPVAPALLVDSDFNIDPMCSVISQIDTQNQVGQFELVSRWAISWQDEETVKTISVLDEIWISGGTTPNACEEFLNRVEQITNDQASVHVRIYGDASGSARQTASVGATSDWEMVKRILGNQHPHIKPTFILKRSNPPVHCRPHQPFMGRGTLPAITTMSG